MLELAAHPIAHYCAANLTPDHEPGARTGEHPTPIGVTGRDVCIGKG